MAWQLAKERSLVTTLCHRLPSAELKRSRRLSILSSEPWKTTRQTFCESLVVQLLEAGTSPVDANMQDAFAVLHEARQRIETLIEPSDGIENEFDTLPPAVDQRFIPAEVEAKLVLPRHGLHASSIEFLHPSTGKLVSFSSDNPPLAILIRIKR